MAVNEAAHGSGEVRVRRAVQPTLRIGGHGEVRLVDGQRAVHQIGEVVVGRNQVSCAHSDGGRAHARRCCGRAAGGPRAASAGGSHHLTVDKAAHRCRKNRVRVPVGLAGVVGGHCEVRLVYCQRSSARVADQVALLIGPQPAGRDGTAAGVLAVLGVSQCAQQSAVRRDRVAGRASQIGGGAVVDLGRGGVVGRDGERRHEGTQQRGCMALINHPGVGEVPTRRGEVGTGVRVGGGQADGASLGAATDAHCLHAGRGVPETVADGGAEGVEAHQSADVAARTGHAARRVAVGDGAAVDAHQPADVKATTHTARSVAVADGATVVGAHQPADVAARTGRAARSVAVADGATVDAHQRTNEVLARDGRIRQPDVADHRACVCVAKQAHHVVR